MAEVEGSTLVARALHEQGTEHVFTVVGGPVIEAVGACGDLGVRPIGARHEQAAVFAALGEGYVAGRVGVALLASGPAVTNTMTGVHVAWDNCWPLVVLGGSAALATSGLGGFQEADSVTMMQSITKWSVRADRAERIPELIARAHHVAMSGRPGPVYVDLPSDVLSATIDESRVRPAGRAAPPARPMGDPSAIERAAELLLEAERPLLIVGKGLRWSQAYEEVSRLVDDLNLPFLSSPMGRGAIPDDHALNVGAARSFALRGADTVVVVGARLNWVFGFGRSIPADANVIQIDIDPEEIGRNRPATVGIVGDAGTVLRQLLMALEGRSEPARSRAAESPWLSDLREHRAKNEAALQPLMDSDAVPMNHHRLFRDLRDVLPRECIITVDGQITFATARQLLPSHIPAARLNPATNGCMGVGVPFAVGAQLARPDLRVLSVNGDSSFGFNGLEVETALRYDLPIVFVVDNNDGIMGGILESRMFKQPHGERVAMYRPQARYDRVIEAFGGHGEHVTRPEELRPALERAFAAGRAALVNVVVDPLAMWPAPTEGRRASALMGY